MTFNSDSSLSCRHLPSTARNIAFTVDIDHAKNTAKAFMREGIPAAAVDGTMPHAERKTLYEQLALGKILVLCSCEALSEGFNVPAVSCILLCRPTQSIAKYIQQLGRGLRLFEGKTDCIVLDQANLVHRYGYIDDLCEEDFALDVSSEHFVKKDAPVKTCPSCKSIIYSFYQKCPKKNCKHIFPSLPKKMATGQLKRLLHPDDLEAFNFIQEGIRTAYEKGLHPDWAIYRYRDKYGNKYLPQDWIRGAVFGENPTFVQKEEFKQYLIGIARQKRIPLKWVDEQMQNHFGEK
jgi:superfamily II DNA or RNA helicase